MIEFGGIDAWDADVNFIYDNGVTIDDPALALEDLGFHKIVRA